MVCPKCKNTGILNTVLGKDFYYCKTCKEEILLEEVFPDLEDHDSSYGNSNYYTPDTDGDIDWDSLDLMPDSLD